MTKNRVNPRIVANLICVLCMIAVLVLQMQPYWQYEKDGVAESTSIAGYVWLPKENKDLETVLKDQMEAEYEAEVAQLTEAEKEELMAAATKGMTKKEIKKLSNIEKEELLAEEMGYAYDLNKNVTAPALQLAATLPSMVLWAIPFVFEMVAFLLAHYLFPLRKFLAGKFKGEDVKYEMKVWDSFNYGSVLAPICAVVCGAMGIWGYLTNAVLKMGADCQRNLYVSIAVAVVGLISVLVHIKRRDD